MMCKLIFFIFLFVFADPPPDAIREVCKPENDTQGLCSRLKNSDGTPVLPKEAVLELISQTSDILKSKATAAGVDPRAVAGALIAENTMNVQVDDTAINALVKLKIAPTGSVMGHQFTIGFGQIRLATAMAVEKEAARIFGRKERSEVEVAAALNTIDGSYEYAAAIIRNVQDEYQKQGFDISKNPGLLATVYNIGEPAERAAKAKGENRKPKLNYFGYFVNKNIFTIEKAIAGSGVSGKGEYQAPAGEEDLQYLEKPLNVFRSAPVCDVRGRGKIGEYNETTSYRAPESQGSIQGYFTIVSRSVDCNLKSWILIRDKNGKMGWVSNEELSKAATVRKPWPVIESAYRSCPVSLACIEEVKKLTGRVLSFMPGDQSVALVSYIGRNPKLPADPSIFSPYCEEYLQSTNQPPPQNQSDGSPLSPDDPRWNRFSKLKKRQLLKKIDGFMEQLKKRFNSKEFEKTSLGNWITDLKSRIEMCDGVKIKCNIDDQKLNKFLAAPNSDATISGYIETLNHVQNNMGWLEMLDVSHLDGSNPRNQGDQSVKLLAASVGPVCLRATEGVPEVQKNINTFLSELNSVGADKNIRHIKQRTEDLMWICRKVQSIFQRNPAPYSTGNETAEKCKYCSFRIDDKNSIRAQDIDALAMQIDKQTYAKMIENRFKDLGDEIISILRLQKSPFSLYSRYRGRMSGSGRSDEEICNYEPFKTKELVSKLIGSNCVQSVMAKDQFIQNSFRTGSKPVLQFETVDSTKFGVQLKTDCDLEEVPEAETDSRR